MEEENDDDGGGGGRANAVCYRDVGHWMRAGRARARMEPLRKLMASMVVGGEDRAAAAGDAVSSPTTRRLSMTLSSS